MPFDVEKAQHLDKLAAARRDGRVDVAANPVLDLVNATRDLYTTSSCAGRIQLLELARLGDKRGSRTLGRWHDAPILETLQDAWAQATGEGDVWLFAQPPIFHVEARTLDAGEAARRLAEDAGFKHSTLRQVHAQEGCLVEWASTERLETPVPNGDVLAWLHPRAVHVFERGRRKLHRLEAALRDDEDKSAGET